MDSPRVFTLLFVLALGTQAQCAQGTNGHEPVKAAPPRDAHWWISLSGHAKNTFLDGYMAAMGRVSNRLFTECADKMKKIATKTTPDGRTIPIVPAPDVDIPPIWSLCVLGGTFDFGFEQQDLRKGVDEFYKDAQNSQVPIDDALQHVRDVLQSKRPKRQGIGTISPKRKVIVAKKEPVPPTYPEWLSARGTKGSLSGLR